MTIASSRGKTHTATAFVERHTLLLNILTFACIALFCVLYIAQVNATVSKGYVMRELEVKTKRLSFENQQIETSRRKAQTLENVASAVKMIGLVPAGSPIYLTSTDPSYALAK